jgi:hypothetical protein
LAGAKPTAIFALMADSLKEKVLALALSRQPWSAWFTDKEFSTDWVSNRAPVWAKFLAAETERYSDVLEIGSFEGRSTIFWLEYLPRSAVTAIDTFRAPQGSMKIPRVGSTATSRLMEPASGR